MCKVVHVEGNKTGHSGKVTALYNANFENKLKERTGHHSLDALHRYKQTSSEQQWMLLPSTCDKTEENRSPFDIDDDNDDCSNPSLRLGGQRLINCLSFISVLSLKWFNNCF